MGGLHLKPRASAAPRSWRQRICRWFVLYAVTPYLVVTLVFVILQRDLMYQPKVAQSLSVADAGLDAEVARDVQIETDDGEVLRGWLIAASEEFGEAPAETPLIIYFPGNSQNRQHRCADIFELARRGFDVLIVDYRGFGDSTGSPSESALTADARLIWQYACTELQYEESTIVVFGESLGGAVALSLWSDPDWQMPQPAALLLSSTFTSMPETVAWHYPAFPFQYFVLDRWPSIDRIPRVDAPVTVFHGTADEIVPVSQGRRLAGAAVDGTFVEVPDGTHNDIPPMLLRERFAALRETIMADSVSRQVTSVRAHDSR